jgi:hypothetical protein
MSFILIIRVTITVMRAMTVRTAIRVVLSIGIAAAAPIILIMLAPLTCQGAEQFVDEMLEHIRTSFSYESYHNIR